MALSMINVAASVALATCSLAGANALIASANNQTQDTLEQDYASLCADGNLYTAP